MLVAISISGTLQISYTGTGGSLGYQAYRNISRVIGVQYSSTTPHNTVISPLHLAIVEKGLNGQSRENGRVCCRA